MTPADELINLKKIVVSENGPYIITGDIPLVYMTQVVSKYGEPLTWRKDGVEKTGTANFLCRCGHSSWKPFCDGSHFEIKFDGSENAPTSLIIERQETYPGSGNIVIKMDHNLCMHSGFCANRFTSISEMATKTADPQVRAQAIAMIERCPSGALTYARNDGEPDIEENLPQQIAVTTEITSDGPIEGPLWVMSGIPIFRSDGKPFEIRNRVTLCNCGQSHIKPLCDGTHRIHPTRK